MTDTQFVLEQAEKMMNNHPDSALALLNKIENPESLEKPLYYEYVTLLVQAKNKNQKDITGDTIIQEAANFFVEKTNNHRKAATALFYWGRLNLYKEQYKTAISQYLKAEEFAEKENDFYLLGMINEDIAIIHKKQFDYEKALERHYMAKDYFSKAGKHNWANNAINHIGNIYLFTEPQRTDKAIALYNEALEGAIQIKDTSSIAICLNNLAVAYSENKDYQKAKGYILEAISLSQKKEGFTLKRYNVLSGIYLATNQIDSAITVLTSLSKRENEMDKYERYSYYHSLYELYTQQNKYQTALEYHEKMMDIYTQIVEKNNEESIREIEAKYDNEKLKNRHNQTVIKKQRTELVFSVIALIMLAFAFAMFMLYQKNRNRRRMIEEKVEAMESLVENEKEASDKMRKKVQQANERLRHRLNEELDIVRKVAYIRFVNTNEAKKTKDYYSLFKDKIETTLEWANIYQLIDEIYPGFRNRLDKEKPFLSEKEKQMCYLLKAGFKASEIAYILGYSPDSAASMKYKLRGKTGFGSATDFDKFLDAL